MAIQAFGVEFVVCGGRVAINDREGLLPRGVVGVE